MGKTFYCHICDLTFSSGYEMADHFRSNEHRDKASDGNLDLLMEKFITGVKVAINSSQTQSEEELK